MLPNDAKFFLKRNVQEESRRFYGVDDPLRIDEVVEGWFNDQEDHTGRWGYIEQKKLFSGKILDMSAGCGTFVLYGLHKGYDVWGVEPEGWKRTYYQYKIRSSNYPDHYLDHIIAGKGENLPFQDNYFDLITTYQTLEHVQDVSTCIREMLRVLKIGGYLSIKCPDYNSFFEPHYLLPFLPKMNKKLAAIYLRFLGRPVLGLQYLYWTTEKQIIQFIQQSEYRTSIEQLSQSLLRERIRSKIPVSYLKREGFIRWINNIYILKLNVQEFARREGNVNLWITKIS